MPQGTPRPRYISVNTQIATDKISIDGIVLTAGSDLATITIYNEATNDNTASKIAMVIKALANTTEEFHAGMFLNEGCYAVISGTSAVATILRK